MKHRGITCPKCNTTFDKWEGLYKFFKCPFCQGLVWNPSYEFKMKVAAGHVQGMRWDVMHKQVRRCG